jgi:FKBP-type peptidyl-prolyl cis-trans isomerase
MKQLSLVIVSLVFAGAVIAQPKKPAAKTASPLKNLTDSTSYAIGIGVANFYKPHGFKGLNTALIAKAISDGLEGRKPLMEEAVCNSTINAFQSRLQSQKSKPKIAEGQAFLAKNKTRPGVKTTESGLQYEVITEGTGAKPGPTDSVVCHYRGTYINGIGFDNSYDRGQPITFTLNGVIPGWTEGLQLMSVGSKYKLYVPYTLGYGAMDYMSIPGGSTLIFEIELLDVKKGQ